MYEVGSVLNRIVKAMRVKDGLYIHISSRFKIKSNQIYSSSDL